MKEQLIQLRDRLEMERQTLVETLKQLDDDLASIQRILSLLDRQVIEQGSSQLHLIEPDKKSDRFADLSFERALLQLFDDNPKRSWKPKEVADALLKEGYRTKAKDFKASVRTMLAKLRNENQISATPIKGGWLYGPKQKNPALTVNSNAGSETRGDVAEGFKATDL